MHLDTQTDVFTHYKIGEENNRIDVYGEHTHSSLLPCLQHCLTHGIISEELLLHAMHVNKSIVLIVLQKRNALDKCFRHSGDEWQWHCQRLGSAAGDQQREIDFFAHLALFNHKRQAWQNNNIIWLNSIRFVWSRNIYLNKKAEALVNWNYGAQSIG